MLCVHIPPILLATRLPRCWVLGRVCPAGVQAVILRTDITDTTVRCRPLVDRLEYDVQDVRGVWSLLQFQSHNERTSESSLKICTTFTTNKKHNLVCSSTSCDAFRSVNVAPRVICHRNRKRLKKTFLQVSAASGALVYHPYFAPRTDIWSSCSQVSYVILISQDEWSASDINTTEFLHTLTVTTLHLLAHCTFKAPK